MLWTDDEIYKVMDGMRFSVLYKGRINDVVNASYAEGTMIDIRDDLAQQLAMLEFINNANKELNEKLHAENERLRETLRVAVQLASIASNWNLDEVEIDEEMVSIYDVREQFELALKQGANNE